MHQTELRNGVLIYLAVEDRQLAILGDAGINLKVPKGFWDDTRDVMINEFKQGNFAKGLSDGIIKAGEQLREHFPYQSDDVNELSDDISFGEYDEETTNYTIIASGVYRKRAGGMLVGSRTRSRFGSRLCRCIE